MRWEGSSGGGGSEVFIARPSAVMAEYCEADGLGGQWSRAVFDAGRLAVLMEALTAARVLNEAGLHVEAAGLEQLIVDLEGVPGRVSSAYAQLNEWRKPKFVAVESVEAVEAMAAVSRLEAERLSHSSPGFPGGDVRPAPSHEANAGVSVPDGPGLTVTSRLEFPAFARGVPLGEHVLARSTAAVRGMECETDVASPQEAGASGEGGEDRER